MKHKANILFIGNAHRKDIESIPNMRVTYSHAEEEYVDLVINNNYDLIFSHPSQIKISITNLIQHFNSIENYFHSISKKKFQHIFLTSSEFEESVCKKKNLIHFPAHSNLSSIVRDLLSKKNSNNTIKNQAIINFEELFTRVDNNRVFIKKVIERFFELKDSRIQDIFTPIQQHDFNSAKSATHKLKGVVGNFAMNKARNTILELEDLILNKNTNEIQFKIQQLNSELEEAKKFYLKNIELFQDFKS